MNPCIRVYLFKIAFLRANLQSVSDNGEDAAWTNFSSDHAEHHNYKILQIISDSRRLASIIHYSTRCVDE